MSRATQERKFPVGKPQLRIQHTVSQHIYVMPVSARSYEVDIWNLNTQIALIRNSLLHLSQQRDVRTEFLDERTKQIESSWDRLARTKPELFGPFKDIHKSFAKSESKWLRENILAIVEFSEHRINQMELVVRCALFEAVLTDVVGNILWEYPQRSKNAIHDSFDAPKKRHPNEKEEDFRGRRIEALVERVNHLPYIPTSKTLATKKTKPDRPVCLCKYFSEGLILEFKQERFADVLEEVHKVRNEIAHRAKASARTLTDEFMSHARVALSEFPRCLIEVAAQEYPNACALEPQGGSERPGYLIKRVLEKL